VLRKVRQTERPPLVEENRRLHRFLVEGVPVEFYGEDGVIEGDHLQARIGSLTADVERFMPWRTVDGVEIDPKGSPELGTLIQGVFEKTLLLSLIRDFTVFGDTDSGLIKIVAGYHQFHAVRRAVEQTIKATSVEGDRRIGVIWHTQGSRKSLLMAFYAGRIVAHRGMENPTLVVITDRNDLDNQLFGTFGTFGMCRDLIRQTPQQAASREDLQKVLRRPSGGVIFTTIQWRSGVHVYREAQ